MSCEFCPASGSGCVVCALLGAPPGESPPLALVRSFRAGGRPAPDYVQVQVGRERLVLFAGGGFQHERYVSPFGWCLAGDEERMPLALLRAGLAARSATWPGLAELTESDFAGQVA